MNEESHDPLVDPELEARIVALVLGEASDLERNELMRLVEERPELAAFKEQIQDVHRRLRDIGTGELAVEDDDWKLSPEKRNAVRAVINSGVQEQPASQFINTRTKGRLWGKDNVLWSLMRVAAVLCVAGYLGMTVILTRQLQSTATRRLASSNKHVRESLRILQQDRALSDGEPAISPDIPASGLASQRPAQGQEQSRVILKLQDGPTLGFSMDSKDSQIAEEGIVVDERMQDDKRMQDDNGVAGDYDRFSGDGIVTRDAHRADVPAEQAPGRDVQWQFGAQEKTIELGDTIPSQPGTANIRGSNEKKLAEDLSEHDVTDTEIRLWFVPAPAPELVGSGGGLGGKNRSSVSGRITEGAKYESPTVPNPADHWLDATRERYRVEDLRRQTSEPRTSAAKELAPTNRFAAQEAVNETNAQDEPFSTFSLHVSDVSFKLAQAALAQGEWPEADRVRIEEFVNAFDYGDPLPSLSEKVACHVEQSIHPFLQQRNLLRIAMRTAAAGRSSDTPLRLTFLLDNSGSMERIDRQQTVRRAFSMLTQQLSPIDQVTLISFASQPRLLADKINGAQSQQLMQLIEDLPSEGGTNIEAALQLAFEKATEQQGAEAQNRIIVLTDGAVNLGDADPERLSHMITTIRDAGIAFDAAGISAEGLNDDILEALTRKGDGRYYLLDSLEATDDGFARQIAGALRPAAKNVKVQVEFNPKRVGSYKLLGFDKHRLQQEDFRNDNVDAAEMAAAEAGVAVYQFEAKPDGEGDVGSVSVRFRDMSTGQMIENRWPIPYQADAPRPEQAALSLRIAASAALLAVKLRGEPLGESVNLKALSDLISGLPERDRDAKRVQQLQLMIQQARQVSGN